MSVDNEQDLNFENFGLLPDDIEEYQMQTALAMSLVESQNTPLRTLYTNTGGPETEFPHYPGHLVADIPFHAENSHSEYPADSGDIDRELPSDGNDDNSSVNSAEDNEVLNYNLLEDSEDIHPENYKEKEKNVEWVIEADQDSDEHAISGFNPGFDFYCNQEDEKEYTSATSAQEKEELGTAFLLNNLTEEHQTETHTSIPASEFSPHGHFNSLNQSEVFTSQSQTVRYPVTRATGHSVPMATTNHSNADFEPLLKPFPISLRTGLPINWEVSDTDDTQTDSTETVYKLFKLPGDNYEHEKIKEEFLRVGIEVLCVERVQNWRLFSKYKLEMEQMGQNRPEDFQLNECYLYHGTAVDRGQMCEEGLDMRLSRKGHFGKGTYFSDNPLKCLKYSNGEQSGQKQPYILKCRVLLGDIKIYPQGEKDLHLLREPKKENARGYWKSYDSVKGCPRDYNEFVIYENRRLLVEYIITYKPPLTHSQSTPLVSSTNLTSGHSTGQPSGQSSQSFHHVQSERTVRRSSNTSDNSEGEADEDVNPEVEWLTEQYGEEYTGRSISPMESRGRPRSIGNGSRSPGLANEDDDINPEVNYESDSERDGYLAWNSDQTERKQVTAHSGRRRRRPPRSEDDRNMSNVTPVMPTPALDPHQQKLEDVRRLVHRQRQQERAAAASHMSPEEHRRQLETVYSALLDDEAKGKNPEQTKKLLDAFEKTYGQVGLRTVRQNTQGQSLSQPPSGPQRQPPEPEEEPEVLVLNQQIREFLQITNITDSAKAKSYVQRANYDIDIAIMMYYDDMTYM